MGFVFLWCCVTFGGKRLVASPVPSVIIKAYEMIKQNAIGFCLSFWELEGFVAKWAVPEGFGVYISTGLKWTAG